MKKLIKIGLNSTRSFLVPIVNFILLTVGVSRFGKENWGHFLTVFLWIFLICLIVNWGNKDYLLRKFSKNPAKIHSAFFTNFFTRSLLLTVSFLLFFFFPPTVAAMAILNILTIHIYSSLDSLVIYHQKFGVQLVAEIIGFLIILSGIYWFPTFDVVHLLFLYCLANGIKIALLLMPLGVFKKGITYALATAEFKGSFYLFLFGASGWLISKVDLYVVSLFLKKATLSQYQILITTFLMLQSVSGLIVLPFTKHIYRISNDKVKEIQLVLYKLAAPIVALGVFSIWILLEKILHMHYTPWVYLLGIFISLPAFFYTLNVTLLIKKNLELNVIKINLIGIFVNTLVSLALVNNYKIIGLLLAVGITQWTLLFLYKFPFNQDLR